MERAKVYLGMLMLSIFTLFTFTSVSIVKAEQHILFTLLQQQSPDTYWAGKENMVYDPWTYPTGPLGHDDISGDWFGMNKGSMGAGRQFISEIGFDTTFGGCNSQAYYFKNLTSEGYFMVVIDDSNDVRYEKVDIKNWATPSMRLYQMSDFPDDWTIPVEGYYGSSGTYDPVSNALDAEVNLNLDFSIVLEQQDGWIDGYPQIGYIIPADEFGDLRSYENGGYDYPITHYVYDPNGGPPPYPGEYVPDGTTQAAEGLFHYMVNNFPELQDPDTDYFYLAVSRDNFKNDQTPPWVGKTFADGGNFYPIGGEWPILTKDFLNLESVWVAAGKDIYIKHLGIDNSNGEDIFPQEVAQQTYYTGAASVLQAMRFFDPDYLDWPTQQELYENYHADPNDHLDVTASEVDDMLDAETQLNPATAPYNWGAFAYENQLDAVKRMIYWIDFERGGVAEPNAPSHVPTNGSYSNNWKTVRGFVSNLDPYSPMPPDLELIGLWLNDPKQSVHGGLGYNVYQTASAFEGIYLPVEGMYRFVGEPPEGIDLKELNARLDSLNLTYAAARPNLELSKSFSAIRTKEDLIKHEEKKEMFDDVRWGAVIPTELLITGNFKDIYSKTEFNGTMAVADLETNDDYQLVLFSQSGKENTASVALMVEEESGAFLQASWVPKDLRYLSEEKALEIGKNAIDEHCYTSESSEDYKDWKIRLVWNQRYDQSRFQPMYEISTSSGLTVYVLQDGSCFVGKDIKKMKEIEAVME